MFGCGFSAQNVFNNMHIWEINKKRAHFKNENKNGNWNEGNDVDRNFYSFFFFALFWIFVFITSIWMPLLLVIKCIVVEWWVGWLLGMMTGFRRPQVLYRLRIVTLQLSDLSVRTFYNIIYVHWGICVYYSSHTALLGRIRFEMSKRVHFQFHCIADISICLCACVCICGKQPVIRWQ